MPTGKGPHQLNLPKRAFGWKTDPLTGERKPLFRRSSGQITTDTRIVSEFGIRLPLYTGRFFTKEQAQASGYTLGRRVNSMGLVAPLTLNRQQKALPKFQLAIWPINKKGRSPFGDPWSEEQLGEIQKSLPYKMRGKPLYYFQDRRDTD